MHDDDIVEITVWGDSDGDDDLTITIEKAKAKEAANAARELAVLAAGVGAAVLGASAGNPLAVAIAVELFIIAAELIIIGFLLDLIALDPPRANYQVAQLPQAAVVSGFGDATGALSDVILTSRALFDWLELWQGARAADDDEWRQRHALQVKDAYVQLRGHLLTAVETLYARFANPRELLQGAGLTLDRVTQASAQVAGQKVTDLPGVDQVLNESILWDSPTLDGFGNQARTAINEMVLQPFNRAQFVSNLQTMWNIARSL